MKFIDFHCDTVYRLMFENLNGTLDVNEGAIDIQRLVEADALVQTFAMFIDQGETKHLFKTCLEMIRYFKQQLENSQYPVGLITSGADVSFERVNAMMSVEEGGVLEGNLSNLDTLYQEGVRSITLTWNYENEIGYPNQSPECMPKGLKPFGFEVLERMESLGMIVDVSHLSDQGFWDVYKHAKKPFIASHSCARSIQNHPRNASDSMIRAIAEKGGMMGLNYYGMFVNGSMHTSLEDLVKHIQHITNVGGSEVLALGSDFDGFQGTSEIADISQLDKLIHILKKRGFHESQIEKIMYRSGIRLIQEILGS